MSINLQPQNLATALVGTQGSINLKVPNRAGTVGNKYPQVVFFNESGCGVQINFQGSAREGILPAGVWSKPIPVYNQDTAINYQVLYVIPNSPVSILYAVLYDADEVPLETAALGNSPIGISGNVTTSNVQTLTNDGNSAPTQIIESTPSGQGSSSFSLNNDGSGFWQVLSANTLKQIINVVRGNTGSGKAVVTIGDATDLTITTYNGLLNKINSDAGAITSDGAGNFTANTSVASAGTISSLPAALPGGTTSYMFVKVAPNSTGRISMGLRADGSGTFRIGNNGTAYSVEQYTDGTNLLVGTGINIVPSATGLIIANKGLGATGAAGASIGLGINGTETDMEITSIGQILSLNSDQSFYIKFNNYWNGTNDKFITTASGQAWQFFMSSAGPQVRRSTNTVTAGSNITWGGFVNVMELNTAGGGSAGTATWVGTTDPTTNASEGDIWIPA